MQQIVVSTVASTQVGAADVHLIFNTCGLRKVLYVFRKEKTHMY